MDETPKIVNVNLTTAARGSSARLVCVSCGSGWLVPCVSIQLTLSQENNAQRFRFTL